MASSTPKAPQGRLQQLIARRFAAATSLGGPNGQFMRYAQKPIWNFLCDHYFRLDIDGWHRIPGFDVSTTLRCCEPMRPTR